MEQVQSHIEKISELNRTIEDPNHPDKFEAFKSLANILKKYEKLIFANTGQNQQNELLRFLMNELAKMTGKDAIRKLIIKCINIATKSESTNFAGQMKANLLEYLKNEKEPVGQKLFVLNIYLENVELGIDCLSDLKSECLDLFTSWLLNEQNELKESTAPIAVSKHVHNIQLLFKTLINFIQKCFDSKLTSTEYKTYSSNFSAISSSISSLLDYRKGSFNMELAYLSSMAQISINLLEFGNNLSILIENCLKKYTSDKSSIDLRDLCLFQAILTISKAAQIGQETNGIEMLKKLLALILNSPNETSNLSQSIAITRTVNFWLIKLVEIINLDENSLSKFTCVNDDFDWFSQLIVFVWSKFDSNIDVVKNTNLQNYKILLSIANRIKKNEVDSFYEEEIGKCMNTSWQSNSKLNALIILLESGLSASKIYKNNPNIASNLMSAISERSTACLVAELYSNLFKTHREEILSSDNSKRLDEWALIWWCPIETILESNDKLRKTYTYEYLLPRMMRTCPNGILDCQSVSKSYAAKLVFAKVKRSLGESDSDSSTWWSIMERAIVHFDDQVRLDSFGLLCDNQKSTEIVLNDEFELIKRFLDFNSDSMSPSFRQITIAHLKKLFYRLKESWLFQIRQHTKGIDNDLETVNNSYKLFITWLFEYLFKAIHLDSTFAKRSLSLTIITTFIEIVGAECSSESYRLFSFNEMLSRDRLFSLIECLWDTYEINKDMSLKLLEKLNSQLFKSNGVLANDYFKVSVDLLSSRRPIDSITSVYLMVLIKKKFTLEDLCQANITEWKSLSLFLVSSCLKELESHLNLAKSNLLLAALNKPMYGPLSSIRNLMVHSVDEIRDESLVNEWRELVTRLLEMCFEISQIVAPIVNSSSPEGIFPKELRSARPDAQELLVTPQMLLVCCWRTMKEVSLFFGDLMRTLPIEFGGSSNYLLSHEQVVRIGDYFVRLLFEARHLGVFEQTYVGFMNMCETFWKSSSKVYCEQPTKWLDHILNAIEEESFRSKLCSTRRGGGLPCFVQAIVSTELVDFGRQSLRTSMQCLLNLAECTYDQDEKNFSKVLAMYILSALFKDTRIGESVLEYAERALITAINGFDSVFWNVRNASTLLFSSLVNRIFGVNRSKEEISKKNSMAGKIFFSKFPLLYQFFFQVISDSNESINTHLNAKLYLVALILGHLFTLSDELADSEALLHTYVPLLLKSLKCPVMKTRVFVAKAILAIGNLERYPSLLSEIFVQLLDKSESHDHNKINGLLLVLNKLADKNDVFKFIPSNEFFDKLERLTSHDFNHCAVNYSLILNILFKTKCSNDDSKHVYELSHRVALKSCELINRNQQGVNLPGAYDLLATIGEAFCMLVDSEPLQKQVRQLLSSRDNSIQLTRGVVEFYRKRDDHYLILDANENELNKSVVDMFKNNAVESILKWQSVKNIHDLKWSCELLVIFMTANKMNSIFTSNQDLGDFWRALINCAQNQTETETRLSVLNLVTHVFESVLEFAELENLYLDRLFEILESYLDQNDEALCVSRFFERNYKILCKSEKLGCHGIRFWDLLIQLLLDLSFESSCHIVCDLIIQMINQQEENNGSSGEFKRTPLAMVRPTLNLLLNTYYEKYPYETIEFLLGQYSIVSECDSNPNTGEEELEVVFDKGVDSIHSSELIYLRELTLVLEQLLSKETNNQAVRECFNKTYSFLYTRLEEELISCASYLNKMKYNEVRFAKIASHLIFIKHFSKFINDSSRKVESISQLLKNTSSNFNTFLSTQLTNF